MTTVIKTMAATSTFLVVYMIAFVAIAYLFKAEQWSFFIAFLPAFISMCAVVGSCEENQKH